MAIPAVVGDRSCTPRTLKSHRQWEKDFIYIAHGKTCKRMHGSRSQFQRCCNRIEATGQCLHARA